MILEFFVTTSLCYWMTKIYKPPSFDNQIVVPKEIFGHNLSLSSVGFYCWLFSQKANVPITFDVIKKTFNVSNHTIRKQIKELEQNKFLSKIPIRNAGKFGGYNYYIANPTMLKKPNPVNLTRSKSLNNIISNTNNNTNSSNINNNINNNNNCGKFKNENLFLEIHKNIEHFLALFPKKYWPISEQEKTKWIDCIYKAITIDKYTLKELYIIIKKIRSDNFWSANFLTILKIRKKNKDGIKYIDFFNELCKSKRPDAYYKIKNLERYFVYDDNNKKCLGAVANNTTLMSYNLERVLTEKEIKEIIDYVETN